MNTDIEAVRKMLGIKTSTTRVATEDDDGEQSITELTPEEMAEAAKAALEDDDEEFDEETAKIDARLDNLLEQRRSRHLSITKEEAKVFVASDLLDRLVRGGAQSSESGFHETTLALANKKGHQRASAVAFDDQFIVFGDAIAQLFISGIRQLGASVYDDEEHRLQEIMYNDRDFDLLTALENIFTPAELIQIDAAYMGSITEHYVSAIGADWADESCCDDTMHEAVTRAGEAAESWAGVDFDDDHPPSSQNKVLAQIAFNIATNRRFDIREAAVDDPLGAWRRIRGLDF